MNRQQRRQSQRRGQESGPPAPGDVDAQVERHLDEAALAPSESSRAARAAVAPPTHRLAPRQFLHEVNVELRKVAWPTRAETLNYSTVVLITLAILMALIFGLDLVFTKVAGFLFHP
jgi:preprotein translocase subunit SecE